MRSRTSHVTAAVVLLICLVCPLIDAFDGWDHALQTGNDTEYTFVVLGLCIGVAYPLAWFVRRFPSVKSAFELVSDFCANKPFCWRRWDSFFVVLVPLSPPVLPLRI